MIDWSGPALMTLPSTWPRTLWSLVKRARGSSSRMKRPVAGCGRGSPHHIAERLRSGRSPTRSSPSTRVTKVPRCGEGAARRSGMSERRYSPLSRRCSRRPFSSGSATRWRPSRFHGSSCLATKSAARAGATAANSVIATIIGAWVGGGLVDRFGRAPVALISGVVGGVAWRASHCSMPLAPSRTLG